MTRELAFHQPQLRKWAIYQEVRIARSAGRRSERIVRFCCCGCERGVTSLLQQILQGFEHHFPVFLGMLARLLGWILVLA